MKYAVIVPDGLGDWPLEALGNKTPMDAGHTPHLDELAKNSILGTLRTAPEGMYPGSDVCGLSLMGYDPRICYTGRAPLEAASLGLKVQPTDMIFRMNLVSVDDEGRLTDYSGGHISTEDARVLVNAVQEKLGTREYLFFPGKMYRHILIHHDARLFDVETDAPHDFQGEFFEKHWPRGKGADLLKLLTERTREILENHPLNLQRASEGKKKANMGWFWGGGLKPSIENFKTRFGIQGSVISAVDLLNGLGTYLGWHIITVPGATGYFDTDYRAKGEYAVRALDNHDLVFVHVEATDEAGHSGLVDEKVKAIEQIDRYVVGPLVERLKKEKDWRLFVAPDHYTPVAKKGHSPESVPFIFAGTDVTIKSGMPYTEKAAAGTGIHLEEGHRLMSKLIHGWNS